MDSIKINKKNNRELFYVVIGFLTLVITIIGATFAYFSASVSSAENAIYTEAADISLELTEDPSGIKTRIVPVDEFTSHSLFSTGGYVGAKQSLLSTDDNNCVDGAGNPFCSVFTFTVTNPSTAAQTVYAKLEVDYNYFVTNEPTSGKCSGKTGDTCKCNYLGYSESIIMNPDRKVTDDGSGDETETDKTGEEVYCGNSNIAFAIFKGTPDDILKTFNQWEVLKAVTKKYDAYEVTDLLNYNPTTEGNTLGTTVTGALGDLVVSRIAVPSYNPADTTKVRPVFKLDALTQTLKAKGSVTYTVLVWLHENWQDQESDEAMSFGAGITFSTGENGTGVTGNINM